MGARASTFKTESAPTGSTRVWSEQQLAIFDWFVTGQGHLIVNACAGTGKTTTLIEGVNRAPEAHVLVCAFSKNIQLEMASRLTRSGAEALTLHALGNRFIQREWRRMPFERKKHDRAQSLVALAIKDTPATKTEPAVVVPWGVRKIVAALQTKGRELVPTDYSAKRLALLATEYGLDPDAQWIAQGWTLDKVSEMAYLTIKYAAENEPTYDVGYDHADQIFLPLAWNLLRPEYELVVVDEMQDMSKAQLAIAQAVCSGRIAGFGDRRQAIYAFRGADTRSMDRIKQQLDADELPLTITYRCAQSIVQRAQRIVPIIEAAPSNPVGSVEDDVTYRTMIADARPGDFILSRLNAPLVRITMSLLMQRRKARMRGRDIGWKLEALVERLLKQNPRMTLVRFVEVLETWESKQRTLLLTRGDEDAAAQVTDQANMLMAFAQDSDDVPSMVQDIKRLFEDTVDADTIICSSIHKAKGLEAKTVYVLQETLYLRGPSEDEENCDYVATTRAKQTLRLVVGVPGVRR